MTVAGFAIRLALCVIFATASTATLLGEARQPRALLVALGAAVALWAI